MLLSSAWAEHHSRHIFRPRGSRTPGPARRCQGRAGRCPVSTLWARAMCCGNRSSMRSRSARRHRRVLTHLDISPRRAGLDQPQLPRWKAGLRRTWCACHTHRRTAPSAAWRILSPVRGRSAGLDGGSPAPASSPRPRSLRRYRILKAGAAFANPSPPARNAANSCRRCGIACFRSLCKIEGFRCQRILCYNQSSSRWSKPYHDDPCPFLQC